MEIVIMENGPTSYSDSSICFCSLEASSYSIAAISRHSTGSLMVNEVASTFTLPNLCNASFTSKAVKGSYEYTATTSERFVFPSDESRRSEVYFFVACSNLLSFCVRLQFLVSTDRSISSEKRFVVFNALYRAVPPLKYAGSPLLCFPASSLSINDT